MEENGGHKVYVSDDHVNGVQQSRTITCDHSFVVDMRRLSHLTEKDINSNSRITRNHSRKGSSRGGEKKNPSTANQRNATMLANSPTATLHGGVQLEKPVLLVAMGPTEPSVIPQLHHQITINNECKRGGKRFGFRHSQSTWSIDPRKILMFFATLSSMGTILLIYFTLSMGKLNEDDNGLN
ncbi:hypothetical protein DH2020_008909 [Rehmannia glutinosa]|uniref:Transmembrane protein n=1 Tax=Rehmannia glutinosa TaxID=99300 RepID=A0ABR0X615_REHGL